MTEVRTATSTEFERGLSGFGVRGHIVKAEKVMKSIGPELDRETSAVKHGENSVADGLVRTFAGTIGAGGISGGNLNGVAGEFKEIDKLEKAIDKIA